MPPKPQVFKSPDGKEFNTRAEWRDYMMTTFYTFKDKKEGTHVKNPGDIEGQQFDIGDCDNCTLVVMDHTEQVQIDMVKNSRIFIGACASSIFIRNCENCVFYTSCRQLRLREVTNSTFYIYSTAEVHIEYSSAVRFAPFNGGYPEHAKHLQAANLPLEHNLWYDIFDHNDAAKTGEHWSLVPESEYEEMWFPAGTPCEVAIQRTKVGSVVRMDMTEGGAVTPGGGNMQSFSADALKSGAGGDTGAPPLPPSDMAAIAPGVLYNTIAREWRMKWSNDNDKQSLQSVQLALDAVLPMIKAIDGVKSVQRIVCGGSLDYKVIIALPADKWVDWMKASFAPEEEFLAAVRAIEGVTDVETQPYTLMPVLSRARTAPEMSPIAPGVLYNTIAREWRMKWSNDNDKQSMQSVQLALEAVLPQLKAVSGVKSVQRIVCGGSLDYKVIIALPADKWVDWMKASFAPEEEFLAAVRAIEGVTDVETQPYTLMPVVLV